VISLPAPDLLALAHGESVIAFVERGVLGEGDEVELRSAGPRPAHEVKPAYLRWADGELPAAAWSGVVVAVHPAALLDPVDGSGRHVLTFVPDGDLAVIRVFRDDEPVLSDAAFAARRGSVEGALRP
jgi:hypothetical protein